MKHSLFWRPSLEQCAVTRSSPESAALSRRSPLERTGWVVGGEKEVGALARKIKSVHRFCG